VQWSIWFAAAILDIGGGCGGRGVIGGVLLFWWQLRWIYFGGGVVQWRFLVLPLF
jgi:hypothetical protein